MADEKQTASGWVYASTASLLKLATLFLRTKIPTHETEKDATKWKKTPRNGKRRHEMENATKRKKTPRNRKRRLETEKTQKKEKHLVPT